MRLTDAKLRAWPACVAMAVVWTMMVVLYGGYQAGHRDGKAAAEAHYDTAAKSMKDMGFCEWTRKARFLQKCWPEQVMPTEAGRRALAEQEKTR